MLVPWEEGPAWTCTSIVFLQISIFFRRTLKKAVCGGCDGLAYLDRQLTELELVSEKESFICDSPYSGGGELEEAQ